MDNVARPGETSGRVIPNALLAASAAHIASAHRRAKPRPDWLATSLTPAV
jgi:hypothetical protein